MLKIDSKAWEEIKRLRAKRDDAAFRIGVALIEFENAKTAFSRIINNSRDDETNVGTKALRDVGCDTDKGEYRIGKDGIIGKLEAGKWVHPDTGEVITLNEDGTELR